MKLKYSLCLLLLFFFVSLFAQILVDHPLQLTGSGTNARISGIHAVHDSADAPNVAAIQNGNLIYAMATGSVNSFSISINPPIAAYQAGMVFNFIANQTVTGAATLNVNNLGAIPIKKYIDLNLTGCEIQTGQIVTVVYDGINFQMTSIFTTTPPVPGPITGPDSVAPFATGVVYSVNAVSGASGYNWTVPPTDTIAANNGTSITVNFGANPQGNITLATTNGCSVSTADTFAVASLFCATGATVTNNSGYIYYTFTNSGTFTASGSSNVDILVVGGGGGGGGNGGGGGGGGGVVYQSNYSVSGNYNVVVGSGGGGLNGQAPPNNGGNSSFGTLVASGGGGGGSRDAYQSGNSGGSGGGGGGGTGGTGGSGTVNQGNSGASSTGDLGCSSAGGGGGGAAASGGGASSETGGTGGNGVTYFGNTYGGGGGGGVTCSPGTGGTGGSGGGGNGAFNTVGSNGINGLGGGGGGGGGGGAGVLSDGGNGGSGVVIVRYP